MVQACYPRAGIGVGVCGGGDLKFEGSPGYLAVSGQSRLHKTLLEQEGAWGVENVGC